MGVEETRCMHMNKITTTFHKKHKLKNKVKKKMSEIQEHNNFEY